MKRRVPQAVSLCLMAGFLFSGAQGFPAFAAETEAVTEADGETVSDTASKTEAVMKTDEETISDAAADEEASLEGELIFAQCEDYVNIRSESSTDGEITAKIYNNGSATILSVVEDDNGDGLWYEITSGNAYGYVKADYFATGEEAEAIAEEIAYNVATVQVEYLNIRAEASTDSEVIDVAPESAQIEVVLYGDDWMKVALGNDVYGYIKAEYVEYDTYYPVAETLEEEAARLAAEGTLSEEAQTETEAAQTEAPQTEAAAIQAETALTETEAAQTEAVLAETEAVQTETTLAETETTQTETAAVQTESAQTETTQTETEAVQTETAQTETEAVQTESTQTETEAVQTESTQTETEAV
ncbi:MAG: SH3 domain-containing protein, partial [Lachnospiraceae bacterium]|nr:SH3 domain-containing protein [Lachnospiraceae bacterium]